MEAEAQCAMLDVLDLTQGSITDDSDIFLFGGRRVYKNIFNQNRHVEMFESDAVKRNLGKFRNFFYNIPRDRKKWAKLTRRLLFPRVGCGMKKSRTIAGKFEGDQS